MYTDVLVPSSLIRETSDRREATYKLGWIARAAAIFEVNDLVVYPDPEGAGPEDGAFVAAVLRYATTPPYLRKEVFDRRDELTHVGVLPPLRLPTWTGSELNDSGSIREGIVTEVGPDGRVWVNCGMQHPIALTVVGDDLPQQGERVAVSISSRDPVRAKLLDGVSTGPRVREQALVDALEAARGLRIAATRYGQPLTIGLLTGRLSARHTSGMTMAFGAPGRGLREICRSLGLVENELFDIRLNTIPDQGSEVVRTEEAMIASLACLRLEE